MKILVASGAAPFVRGGAELLADRLVDELRTAGHEAELVRIPLGDTPEQLLDSIVSAATMELVNVDRVIGLKFPAYLIPHPDTVIWLVHQYRQAYDPPPVGWTPSERTDPVVEAVRAADLQAFEHAQRLYAISPMIAERLHTSTGISAPVLLTPPHSEPEYRNLPAEGYILALGRVSGGKRQLLAVQAMRHAEPGYRLVIAGAPDNDVVQRSIEAEIAAHGLEDRVTFIARFISEDEKLDLLARCIGSVYLPVDEDSYGYVCYEAAMSEKPSITATDSGGTLTLVRDGESGFVVEPDPESVAIAFDTLARDPSGAARMGVRARELAVDLDLSWRRVVRELTQ